MASLFWQWEAVRTEDGIKGVTSLFGYDFNTTGVFGLGGNETEGYQERGFPWWATLPGHRNLSMGRRWHFFFAWLFLFNGLAYLLWSLGSGHLRRDLAPSGKELKQIGTSIREHLRLKFPRGEEAKRYNVLQKLAYLMRMLRRGLRRFPPPWTAERTPGGYVVKDATLTYYSG